ncbi:heparinase II/III family protein [Zobellia galactanivorans]|uniref:heparinase II/III family protein n=1 Tax=Zobellia galactanivorans (strain DSM 12802 / CCUG 47099 / CIP 106680 / NCIMB 13871 / Dsij) TaxID=63186 RepID=UPI0026E2F653|nr:heparinase II/III family protein [Zobellia galactanivorans]MDO6809771.1 heparinase II/III family protein [Zobellia galactanivorans]
MLFFLARMVVIDSTAIMIKQKWDKGYSLFLMVLLVVACSPKRENVRPGKLDITTYLQYADKDTVYPTEKQLELLSKAMPKAAFAPAPDISDRAYWTAIANTGSGQDYLEKAKGMLGKEPEVPISDSIYRLANKQGNRGIYKPRYYRTMDRLEHFILGECLENKGRFLPQIEAYGKAIMAMKSWLHPNHDDKDNGVLEGRRVTIDLGARKFGSILALAGYLLGDKLPKDLRHEIKAHIQKRITDSYLKSTRYLDGNNKWIKSTSNWNSVCTSGTVLATLINSASYEERLATVGSALNSMDHYLTGFGDDGYCSEGLGYWGYGFGHYLYLAQILYDYTDGRIDLFVFDNADKLKNVGNFPENFEIQNGTCAPFADGVSSISSKGSNFAHVLSASHYGAIRPTEIRMEEAAEQLIAWQHPEMFEVATTATASEVPGHTYFDDFGMVISRGKQERPFSVAIKAGHNAENHNHSDVGTYELFLDTDMIAGDIGAPSYTAGAFSPDNKARSSWGHPVPMVNNTLQSNGIDFKGVITETAFNEGRDKVVMDIKAAYELPVLQELTRTMINDKSASGSITIEDHFMAGEAVHFGTAITTLNTYEIVDDDTVIIQSENHRVKAKIRSEGFAFRIQDTMVPVKHLREGGPAYRIGIDATGPAKEGRLTITYTPIYE